MSTNVEIANALTASNWFNNATPTFGSNNSNNQGFQPPTQPPTQPGGPDPSYGTNPSYGTDPDAQFTGNVAFTPTPQTSSSSGGWPITAGQQLTSMLTPQYPNQASLLAIKERLLTHAGGDAMLNKTEGAKALRISEQQMDMIIKNLEGADAVNVSVQKVMEHFEEYASGQPLQLITDNGINEAIMDMMGGLGNFNVWAGEDDHINQSEFWGLVQALSNGLTVNGQPVNIERPQANIIFEQIAGADGLIDRNEFVQIAQVQEDGSFDWETAQQNLAQLAAAVGQVGSGSQSSGSGSYGLSGAHPGAGGTGGHTVTENNNSGNTGGNII